MILAEYVSEDGKVYGKLINCTMREFISFNESKKSYGDSFKVHRDFI